MTEQEIFKTLNGIGDLKSLDLDGYGAIFFKASWKIVKDDVIATIMDFFDRERLYKAFNSTVFTLIHRSDEAKSIREYIHIYVCTTLYKIISKILTDRIGKVLESIIGQNHTTFIPNQNIHNHILLAYELIKGYSRKEGASRCMTQLDLQKTYDMVDWKAFERIMQELGFPINSLDGLFLLLPMCLISLISMVITRESWRQKRH